MKLGLTGRIACGKSTVSKILSQEGFRIIDCDKIGHELLFQPEIKRAVVAQFGDCILDGENVCRKRLGAIVFQDISSRKNLEKIMRPRIHHRVIKNLLQQGSHVVDSFELIGTPIQTLLQETWVVTCDQNTQLDRLMGRNGFSREEALRRMGAQMSQEEMVAGADVVIDNSGSPERTEGQVIQNLRRLRIIQ